MRLHSQSVSGQRGLTNEASNGYQKDWNTVLPKIREEERDGLFFEARMVSFGLFILPKHDTWCMKLVPQTPSFSVLRGHSRCRHKANWIRLLPRISPPCRAFMRLLVQGSTGINRANSHVTFPCIVPRNGILTAISAKKNLPDLSWFPRRLLSNQRIIHNRKPVQVSLPQRKKCNGFGGQVPLSESVLSGSTSTTSPTRKGVDQIPALLQHLVC